MVRSCDFSSPDPLGVTEENLGTVPPLKQCGEKSGATPKKPLANTSSNVRVQDFYLTTPPSQRAGIASPFKLVAEAENSSSPWRIRVTVEAEQDSTQHSKASPNTSPAKRLAERMTTTMVPLKDADEPSPVVSKRGRGRPKKSIDSLGKTARTPKQKSSGSRKTLPASTKKPSNETGRHTPTPSKRGRGRPRKSADEVAEDLELRDGEGDGLVNMDGEDHPKGPKITRTTRPRSQGPRKATLPSKSTLPFNSIGLSSERVHNEEQLDLGSSAIADSPDRLDFNSDLPDSVDEHGEFDSVLDSEGFSMVSVSSLQSARLHSSSPFEPDLDGDDNESSADSSASLISVPHTTSRAKSPVSGLVKNLEESQETHAQKAPSPPSISAPSAHFSKPVVEQTPSITSPKTIIPPAVKSSVTRKSPRALHKVGDGTPKLVRVVRAGITLQGVLSPQSVRTRSGNTGQEDTSSLLPAKSPKERMDDLFSGFGAGTRRELRAGLRLGEELAKRQVVPHAGAKYKSGDDVFGREEMSSSSNLPSRTGDVGYSLKLPESSPQPLYPILSNSQLPSPARSDDDNDDDRMSWKVDTPNVLQATNVQAEPHSRENGVDVRVSNDFEGSTIAREEEEYRLEREAVIRQIQAANSSQVMVINSDSEDEYENNEEDDIWQEQAHSSGVTSAPLYDVPTVLLPNRDHQPRRSQLPSPWRRQSEVTPSSQVSTNESDSFWQPSLCEELPETNDADLNPQDSLNTSPLQDARASFNDSTFEPESPLHISPIKQNIQDTQKISSTTKQETLTSSVPGEEEYDETWTRASGETLEREEQPGQDLAGKKASSISQAPQKACTGGKKVEACSSEQREKVRFVSHQGVQVAASTSWLGYLASFVPTWGESTAAMPHRLPNGKSKLPRPGSLDGPLSLYMPWTTAHYNTLYFHYAASKEGRTCYVFNAKSASARYLGRVVGYRGWEKPVTKEDVAIVDAFMVDLKARGGSEIVTGGWRIDDEVAVFKVFTLWHGGVQRGECEVGIGKIGLAAGSEEVWRPEMESWYQQKRKDG